MKLTLISSILLFLFFNSILSQKIIVLNNLSDTYPIGKYTQYYIEKNKTETIETISSPSFQKNFTQSKSDVPNFGSTGEIVWFKFSIQNNSDPKNRWLLRIDYPLLGDIRLYFKNTDCLYDSVVTGAAYPFSKRKIKSNCFAFSLSGIDSTIRSYFLRIETETTILVPISIMERGLFEDNDRRKFLFYGVFYGALIALIIYNFFLWISIKEATYIYYVLYISTFGFYQLIYDGLIQRFFDQSGISLWYDAVLLSGSGLLIFGSLFARSFLERKKYIGNWDYIYLTFIILGVIPLILIFAFPFHSANKIAILLTILWISGSPIGGIVAIRKKYKPARIFVLATLLVAFGLITRTLKAFGGSYDFYIFNYVWQSSIMFEALILSFALGNKVNTVKREEELEKAKIRNRIARDLHDEIGSNLSSISILGKLLQKKEKISADMTEKLDQISDIANKSAEALREIVWFISTEHSSVDSLVYKIKEATSKQLQELEYEFNLDIDSENRKLELSVCRNIYLSYKEIVNNIRKHSKANNVKIDISLSGKTLKIIVKDNGIGFNLGTVKKGNGLHNIFNRANEIGADIEYDTNEGEGTIVKLSCDIKKV